MVRWKGLGLRHNKSLDLRFYLFNVVDSISKKWSSLSRVSHHLKKINVAGFAL